jgi:hypothetical protein
MSRESDLNSSATEIWNRRYSEGDGTCTRPPDGSDPIDYTQHDFLFRLRTAAQKFATEVA